MKARFLAVLAAGLVCACSGGAADSNAQAGAGNKATSTATDVSTRVKRVVATVLDQGSGQPSLESRLIEDLHADDLDRVEIVMALEEEFGISIDDTDAEGMRTVGDAVRVVRGKLGSQ